MTVRTSVAPWAGLAMVLWVPTALAADGECDSNDDCELGFVCEVVGAGDCPAIACAEGADCEQPACDLTEYKACVPGPCDSDADCGDNQVCYQETYEVCSGGSTDACARDGECAEPEPAEESSCTTEQFSQCVPRWAAPCEESADCGPGFTCEALEQCACKGSAGSAAPCAEGEECPEPGPAPAPEPECSCEPTDTNYCKLVETSCTADSDCATGLVCADVGGDAASCGGSAPSSGSGSGDSAGDPAPADGGVPPEEQGFAACEPVETDPEMLCVPADFDQWGLDASDLKSLGEHGGVLSGSADDEGGSATSGRGGEGAPTQEADGSEEGASNDDADEDDGCSVTSARAASSQGLWLLLAAALLARRRRA